MFQRHVTVADGHLSMILVIFLSCSYVEGDSLDDYGLRKREVCKWQSFEADCPTGSVILIDQAYYGRMRLGSCLTTGYGHVGCFADVIRYVERRCAGRNHCSLPTPDVELDRSPHRCPHELLTYLEVTYHCQPVLTADDQNCTNSPIILTPADDRYLASIVTQQTGKGSKLCPWAINTTQGQIVTLSLLDFAVKSASLLLSNDTIAAGELCIIYAEISYQSSSGEQRKILMCGGTETRDNVVYTSGSTGGVVNLTIHSAATNRQVYFLVRITVRCVDESDPAGERSVPCPAPRESRVVDKSCDDEDCSQSSYVESPVASITGTNISPYSNQGLLIVVVIGTAMLLSFVIIAIGLVCLRRRSRADSSLSVYHSACIYDMPPPNTVLTAHYPLSSESDGYRSVHPVTPSYKELYPVLASHERLAACRDYATTLQMRQTAAAACDIHDAQLGLPCSLSSPEVWACPVHGQVTVVDGTLPTRRSIRHRLPPCDRLYEMTTGPDTLPGELSIVPQVPDSPFYHELDPNALNMVIGGQHSVIPVSSPTDAPGRNNELVATSLS